MTPSRPPKFATWLLKYLGCSDSNDAVLGDLAERYQQGTTRWYWKQVLTAIVVSAFNQIRGHKVLTLRTVFVGWSFFSFVLLPLTRLVMRYVLDQFFAFEYPSSNDLSTSVAFYVLIAFMISWAFVMGLLSGWLVARVSYRRRAIILLTATTIVLSFVSGNYEGAYSPGFWLGVVAITFGILIGGLFKADQRNLEIERL